MGLLRIYPIHPKGLRSQPVFPRTLDMALPIVFLHYGKSEYLPFTLGRAKMTNLNSPVILIGDDANKGYLPFVEHVHMNRYARQAVAFQSVYKHFSPNSPGYEMFCFMRWFILRDFMKAHGLNEIFHMDSDVLISVNVQKERENWSGYGLTVLRKQCAGNMFVNGTATLDQLCDIIWELYTGPDSDARLAALYARDKGVCDMTTLGMICDQAPHHVAEMDGIQPDGSFWDANIKIDQGFEMQKGFKAIRWINSQPFGRHIATGREILFKSLHYQGGSKDQIGPAFRQMYPQPAAAVAA
jgi:hypothetical protein